MLPSTLMSSAPSADVYTDFSGLAKLRHAAKKPDDATLRAVARQFEGVFTQMMVKSMRQASLGDDLLGGPGADTYRDMFDQQMSLSLSQGKGMGLADAILGQLRAQAGMAKTEATAPIVPLRPGAAIAGHSAATARSVSAPAVTAHSTAQAAPVQHSATPASTAPAAPATPEAFIQQVWPAAKRAAAQLGVSPRVLVAQAALETGWGKHMPHAASGASGHNYFGIKAHGNWAGDTLHSLTTEVRQGVEKVEKAAFRAYDSIAASFNDFVAFMKGNPRYSKALAASDNDGHFVDALQKAGYATDPHYASKIKSIMHGRHMNNVVAQLEAPAGAADATVHRA